MKRSLYILGGLVGGTLIAHVLMAQVDSSPAAIQAADNSSSAASAAVIIAQFLTSVKVSGFVSWGIQALKNSENKALSWISHNTPWAARLISLVTSALTASGIDYVWHGNTGQLVINGLGAVAIGHAVWHTATNYLIQKGWYKTVMGGGASEIAVVPGGVAVAPAKGAS